MAISFPSNPNVNDTFTVDDKTFLWTGDYWRTLSSAVTFPGIIKDADNDTKVEVEQSVDEDTIRFSVAGTEKASLDASGLTVTGDISVTGSYVGLSSDSITDADGDTKIQVEESADEDTIRFDIAGAEKMTLDSSSLTVSDSVSADHFAASGTGANLIPSGTTAERPVSPTAGMIRFNETTGEPEWYSSAMSDWVNFRNAPVINVSYLVIAGGGSGGYRRGGGGGAGGYRNSYSSETSGGGGSAESIVSLSTGTDYTVTVGAGGPGITTFNSRGNNGVASTFATITSVGGGGGGSDTGGSLNSGVSGGSGGGAGATDSVYSGGSGTSNQGYRGGSNASGYPYPPGGGGGAGAVGGNGSGSSAGAGGSGVASTITGSSVTRGGGGGGGATAEGGSVGAGGSGGGGAGAGSGGTSGTANTGGGGGGNAGSGTTGSGGSGVVILRYPSGLVPTISAGLTSTTTTVGSDKVTVFTAGTGTVSWS